MRKKKPIQAKLFIERPQFPPSKDLKPLHEPRVKDITCPQPEKD